MGSIRTGGLVVQSWTNTNSSAWQLFDQKAGRLGRPAAVWVQVCVSAQNGATYDEVRQMIANARQHAASGATIYITGQPDNDHSPSAPANPPHHGSPPGRTLEG